MFDAQGALAAQLGLVDTRAKRASEQLMQRYYRAAKLVSQVNTVLLHNVHARLYPAATEPVPIDDDFQQVDELLDITDPDLFLRRPSAMLDAFLMMQRHRELKGMTARTLRALWRDRKLIDAPFRRDPANRARFIAMFRAERGLLHELRRMNLYGILGQYLPVFGRIVGQMQHDLFHVYTVDEHILMVIRNLRRFTEAQHAHEYPLCSRLIADFERREVLYVAGLFHDIAKGRGGDHSALGARDARRFCREHGLSHDDTELVAWLVADHLVMSATAQKQDLTDPEVIAAFARRMGTERRLAALYLLTVADIRGTSPKVWNNWKGKLLEDLYHATRAVLAGTAPTRDDQRQHRRAADGGRAPAAPVRGARRRGSRSLAPPRHALLPAAHGRGDRVARAPPVLARRPHRARGEGAPGPRRRGHAGARVPAGPEGALRAPVRLLRARRTVDPRGEDPHDARRLRARHVRAERSGAARHVVPRDAADGRVRADAPAQGTAAARGRPPRDASRAS